MTRIAWFGLSQITDYYSKGECYQQSIRPVLNLCQSLLTESIGTQLSKFRNKRCRENAWWIHTLNCALIQNSPLLLSRSGSATDSSVRRTNSFSLILDVRASSFQYKIHWPFYLGVYLFIFMKLITKAQNPNFTRSSISREESGISSALKLSK